MINFFSKYKFIFYLFNFLLILLYLYPGSLLGCFLYNDCKSQPQITAFAPATAGMSGSDMNAQSAEFVGSGSPTGVDVKTVGGTNISTNSSVVHNSMSEETGTGDKSYKDNLYDF